MSSYGGRYNSNYNNNNNGNNFNRKRKNTEESNYYGTASNKPSNQLSFN